MNLNPSLSSKTFIYRQSLSVKALDMRNLWISFLVGLLVVSPIVGSLWNPYKNHAQAEDALFEFASHMGGTAYDEAYSIATDSDLNVYTVGYFEGTADFDPGVGVYNLTSPDFYNNTFISKLDSDGNFIWAKMVGGYANSVAVDTLGYVYVGGVYNGTLDFDPGVGVTNLSSSGSNNDGYILKLDSDGNYIWAKSVGGTANESVNVIKYSSNDELVLTGVFGSIVDFDLGMGVSNLTSNGQGDIFIAKYNSDGNYIWAKSVGGTANETRVSFTYDGDGNELITGSFGSTVDFDPGVGTSNLTATGSFDTFILKLDSDGNYVWAKSVGGTGEDFGSDIEAGIGNEYYVWGSFGNTIDMDPGAGVVNLISQGSTDMFLLKLDVDGSYVFSKQFGSTGYEFPGALAIDSQDNLLLHGTFADTIDSDPGIGVSNFASFGSGDIFISKLDSDGNYIFSKQYGGTGSETSYGIAIDALNNIHTSGSFYDTADFDPGLGVYNISSAGEGDIFVLKLSSLGAPTVITATTTSLNQTTVTLNGEITVNGGEDVIERGFEYGLTTSYGMDVSESAGPYTVGVFDADLITLTCNTLYHYRSFATNSEDTGYSSDTSFVTAACPSSGGSSSGSSSNSGSSISDGGLQFSDNYVQPNTNPSNPINPRGPAGTPLIAPAQQFLRNLGYGSIGEDVKRLQQFLNVNEYDLSTSGVGSSGSETTYFGPKTKQAVKIFQETFAFQILAPLGLTSGTGYFGAATRTFVNALLK